MSQPPWTVRDAGFPDIPPDRYLAFLEPPTFHRAWDGLGLGDDALLALQAAIMAAPVAAPVVPGTGGIRKLRFAPLGWDAGKRGGLRVWYAYFPAHRTTALLAVYAKNQREDLSAANKKKLAALVVALGRGLAARRKRR